MPRPVEHQWAVKQARKHKLKIDAAVWWDESWHVIWKDDEGPAYSSRCEKEQARLLGVRDWVRMDNGMDTITERMMRDLVHLDHSRYPSKANQALTDMGYNNDSA